MNDRGLFTGTTRDSHWLSAHLASLPQVRRLTEEIAAAATLQDLDALLVALDARIQTLRPAYPAIGPPSLGSVIDAGGEPKPWDARGSRVSTNRFHIVLPVTGDTELLRYWPDESERELKTVHHEFLESIGGFEGLNRAAEDVAKEYWRLEPTWRLGVGGPTGTQAVIYTYLDLTYAEEAALTAAGGLLSALQERCDRASAIVGEISAQTKKYFEVDLPRRAREMLDGRANVLRNRFELVKDLALPTQWELGELEVEPVPDSAVTNESGAPSAWQTPVASPSTELHFSDMSYRLAPSSFEKVVRTIRVWADAVEQNPRGFSHLDEDSVSDLLAATLNATTPRAGREVFSRNGKVDIHVSANVLAEGSGPVEVFLCEAKKAVTRKAILEGLNHQLFRYAPPHTTQLVLLALCPQQNFAGGKRSVQKWAKHADGFFGVASEGLSGWPVFKYDVSGRTVEVCLAMVSVPAVKTRSGVPK